MQKKSRFKMRSWDSEGRFLLMEKSITGNEDCLHACCPGLSTPARVIIAEAQNEARGVIVAELQYLTQAHAFYLEPEPLIAAELLKYMKIFAKEYFCGVEHEGNMCQRLKDHAEHHHDKSTGVQWN